MGWRQLMIDTHIIIKTSMKFLPSIRFQRKKNHWSSQGPIFYDIRDAMMFERHGRHRQGQSTHRFVPCDTCRSVHFLVEISQRLVYIRIMDNFICGILHKATPIGYEYWTDDFKKTIKRIWIRLGDFVYTGGGYPSSVWGFYDKSRKKCYIAPINHKKPGKEVRIEDTTPYHHAIT